MKHFLVATLCCASVISGFSQQKEGKVTYQRSSQFTMSFNSGGGPSNPVTQTQTQRFELNFADNKMVWQQLPEDIQENASNSSGATGTGNIVIRTFGGGDDVVYCDFSKSQKIEGRELFDKKFVITDSIRRGTWKLTEETKTILGFACRKATSERVFKRTNMQMENGKMERKEVDDTSLVIAWFTMEIPVPAGPEMQGQLPGLILELETNSGKTVYTAVEFEKKADKGAIKPPAKGKKVSVSEFAAEREKMLEEMNRNNNGNIRFRTS